MRREKAVNGDANIVSLDLTSIDAVIQEKDSIVIDNSDTNPFIYEDDVFETHTLISTPKKNLQNSTQPVFIEEPSSNPFDSDYEPQKNPFYSTASQDGDSAEVDLHIFISLWFYIIILK